MVLQVATLIVGEMHFNYGAKDYIYNTPIFLQIDMVDVDNKSWWDVVLYLCN